MDLLPDCGADDTTGHGSIVCRILDKCSNRLEFNLYRVIQDSDGGKIWERHLINAIGYAHVRDNVDLINISAGNDHSGDGNDGCVRHNQPCKVREAAEKAINDGIPVVSAAGNDDQYSSVCCPSLLDRAISVGGFVSKCTCDTGGTQMSSTMVAGDPPLACWTANDTENYPFCSGMDCFPLPEYSCSEFQENVNWSGNVDPVWNKPDIFGPAAFLVVTSKPAILPATSWATPVVTAIMAEIMAVVRNRGKEVPPYLLRQSVENTAKQLDSGEQMLFDAEEALYYVCDELDLPRPSSQDSTEFNPGVGL